MIGEIINAISVFGFGVVFGWMIRRPDVTLEHKLGKMFITRATDVMERRKFVGDGFILRTTDELKLPDDRTIKIIVEEGAA